MLQGVQKLPSLTEVMNLSLIHIKVLCLILSFAFNYFLGDINMAMPVKLFYHHFHHVFFHPFISFTYLFIYLFIYLFTSFLGLYLRHMEVPRLGVEVEL